MLVYQELNMSQDNALRRQCVLAYAVEHELAVLLGTVMHGDTVKEFTHFFQFYLGKFLPKLSRQTWKERDC